MSDCHTDDSKSNNFIDEIQEIINKQWNKLLLIKTQEVKSNFDCKYNGGVHLSYTYKIELCKF